MTDDLLHDHPDDPPLYAEICIYYIHQIHSGRSSQANYCRPPGG